MYYRTPETYFGSTVKHVHTSNKYTWQEFFFRAEDFRNLLLQDQVSISELNLITVPPSALLS